MRTYNQIIQNILKIQCWGVIKLSVSISYPPSLDLTNFAWLTLQEEFTWEVSAVLDGPVGRGVESVIVARR